MSDSDMESDRHSSEERKRKRHFGENGGSPRSSPRYRSPSSDELADEGQFRKSSSSTRKSSTGAKRKTLEENTNLNIDRSPSRDELDHTFYGDDDAASNRSRRRSSTPRSVGTGSSADRSRRSTPPPSFPSKGIRYKLKLVLRGHTRSISQVRFSPDGRWIASASADASIKVWDASTGKLLQTLEGHLAGISTLAWSPDSKTIASGSDDKVIRLWNRATGKANPNSLFGHHNYVYSVAFSPKGNMLASGSYDEAVFLWDVRAGRQMRSLPAHQDPVGCVEFNRDGTMVASCATDGLIRIWDTATGQCLRTIVHEDNAPVVSCQFSPNGKYVLAWTLDGSIRLWDYNEGLCKKTYQGHLNKKYSIGGAFGVCGSISFIVSGSEDGKVVIWDVETKDVLQEWTAHGGVVTWADTRPGLECIATAGLDGVVRVWSNEDGIESIQESEETLQADLDEKLKRNEVGIEVEVDDYANHDTPTSHSPLRNTRDMMDYDFHDLPRPSFYDPRNGGTEDFMDYEPPNSQHKHSRNPPAPKVDRAAFATSKVKSEKPLQKASTPKTKPISTPKVPTPKPPKPTPAPKQGSREISSEQPQFYEEDLSSKPRCQRCHKSKKGCDRQRPCQRCKDAGIPADQCISEDESNSRKGRYGHRMGVPLRKD